MSKQPDDQQLGRRERQIMAVVFRLGEASVADVKQHLADPPSYSAVRTMIRHLEGKGHLRHRRLGNKYVYRPTRSRESASRAALRSLLETFFGGSPTDAVAAILDDSAPRLQEEDFARLEQMIERAKTEGS